MAVYTQSNLTELFSRLTESIIGAYDILTWERKQVLPSLTQKEIDAVFTDIYNSMRKDGCFENCSRVPESPKALEQQMRWATTTQDKNSLNKGQQKMQRRNRLAAYNGGFMTMCDIVYLESRSGCYSPF
jgi:hypothetical protein